MRRPYIWEIPGLADSIPPDREFWIEEIGPPYFTTKPLASMLGWTQRNLNLLILKSIRSGDIEINLGENGKRNITLFHLERLAHSWLKSGNIDYSKFASILMIVKGIAHNHKLL